MLFSIAAMETRRYSLAVVSNLLLNGSWRKDTKTSLCLSQPGERNSQGLMPSSQVRKQLLEGYLTLVCDTYVWAGATIVL